MTRSKLTRLEELIVESEEQAEQARWDQAKEVHRRKQAGETERAIAATWLHVDGPYAGEPYSHRHVNYVDRVWRKFGKHASQDRPPFTKAYDEIVHAPRREKKKTQRQRSVNLPDEVWEAFKEHAEDAGYESAAEALGVLAQDFVGVELPYPITDEEREATVDPVDDKCFGVDRSFDHLVEALTEWIDSAIATLDSEDKRKVLVRLLKRKLNELEATPLNKHHPKELV